VTRVAGRQDQRPHHPAPAGVPVDDEAHLPEVDLQLTAGLTISHPDRHTPGRAAHTEDLQRVAVQRALRHDHPLADQQLTGLHHSQLLLDQPRLELVVVGHQSRPRRAVTGRAVRAHPLTHHTDQHVGELLLAGLTDKPRLHAGRHIAPDRLAVHHRQPLDRAEPLAPQPQPQNLTNLEHWNLPERHRHLPGPLNGTGGECTLSDTAAGGPRVVPSLAEGRSHAPGGTTAQVVPCSWRATTNGARRVVEKAGMIENQNDGPEKGRGSSEFVGYEFSR